MQLYRSTTSKRFEALLPLFAAIMVIAITLFSTACGGGGAGSSTESPTDIPTVNTPLAEEPETSTISVSGRVNKGVVSGASVSLYAVLTDGERGELLAGPFTTDSAGKFTGEVETQVKEDALSAGGMIAVASGGAYIDESSGQQVNITHHELAVPWDGSEININPLTAIPGGIPADLSAALGFAPAETTAIDITLPATDATADEKRYAAWVAAFSFLNDPGMNTVLSDAGLGSANLFDLVYASMLDIADAKLDGLSNGQPIAVDDGAGGSANYPALDTIGFNALIDAVNLASSTYNLGVSVDTLPSPISMPIAAPLATDANIPGGNRVRIDMDKGSITIELYPDAAPNTVANFKVLAASGFYDGLNFHRVVFGFVAQAGDPNGDGSGGPGYSIQDEASGKLHVRGAVAMAKTSAPNSAGSQFYITLEAQPHLDGLYTVFGQVVLGMDVVDSIRQGDVMNRVMILP